MRHPMLTRRETGPDRYELVLEEPVRRGTASVNLRWEDKAVFDSIQAWLSYRKGRPVTQWDVFTFILATALESDASPLREAKLNVID